MKRLFIILIMLFLMCPMFAKKHRVFKSAYASNTYDVTPQIQSMIDRERYLISIALVTYRCGDSNSIDYAF